MTVALSIEMSFLGMTFSCTMLKQPLRKGLPAVLIAPGILVVGGVIGSASAAALEP